MATNNLGDTSASIILTGAPSIPVIVEADSEAHSYSYDLTWDVVSSYLPLRHEVIYWAESKVSKGETDSPPRDSTKLQVQSIDTHTSYSLNGLQPETEYMVCVRAYNKWGWSNLSKTYMFKTSVAIAEVTQTENIKQNVSGDTRDTLKYNGPDPLLLQPSVSRACDKFSVYQKYLIFIPCDSIFLLFLSTMFLL